MGSYIPGSGIPPERTLILITQEMADLSPGSTRGQERFFCFAVRLVSHDVILFCDFVTCIWISFQKRDFQPAAIACSI